MSLPITAGAAPPKEPTLEIGGTILAAITAALAPYGLILRGGFHPEPDEPSLEGAGTLLLVGNAGPAMWSAFAPHADGAPDPLKRWTRQTMEPVAERLGARALYPFGEPHWPFQRWALRAEALHPSPLGLLIHAEYGLCMHGAPHCSSPIGSMCRRAWSIPSPATIALRSRASRPVRSAPSAARPTMSPPARRISGAMARHAARLAAMPAMHVRSERLGATMRSRSACT